MASCLCRHRRRVLFFCSPCILLLILYTYVSMVLIYIMNSSPTNTSPVLPARFIADGLERSRHLAPYPVKTFWKSDLEIGALWNAIQHVMDREHNPILKPRTAASTNISDLQINREDCYPNYELIETIPNYMSLPRQLKDFVISMHCRAYPLIIDPVSLCGYGQLAKRWAPTMLMAIKSQTENYANREAIRQTWGRSGWVRSREGRRNLVRRVFLLGKGKDMNSEKQLQLESEQHGDIIQWDFMDTFFNLTLKDVLFWQWMSLRCPHARYVFKGDDDIFLRTPAVLNYLLTEERKAAFGNQSVTKGSKHQNIMESFVMGDVITNAAPLRTNLTKYYIPESFYKGLYPTYPGGGGVVYSGSLAHKLLKVSRRVHLYPIDDVYLGMCLQRLGVFPVHQPAFLTFDFPKNEPTGPCANHTILLIHKRSPDEMHRLWVETSMPSPECRNATLRTEPSVV